MHCKRHEQASLISVRGYSKLSIFHTKPIPLPKEIPTSKHNACQILEIGALLKTLPEMIERTTFGYLKKFSEDTSFVDEKCSV